MAQVQNPADELAVVVFALAADGSVGLPDLLPEGVTVRIGHDGNVRGGLQGETPAFFTLLLGTLAGGI